MELSCQSSDFSPGCLSPRNASVLCRKHIWELEPRWVQSFPYGFVGKCPGPFSIQTTAQRLVSPILGEQLLLNCSKSPGSMFVTGKAAVLAMGAWIYKVISADSGPKPTVASERMGTSKPCWDIHILLCSWFLKNYRRGNKRENSEIHSFSTKFALKICFSYNGCILPIHSSSSSLLQGTKPRQMTAMRVTTESLNDEK